MADADKNIVIFPFRGNTSQPAITFTGSGNDPITLRVTDGTTGTGLTAGAALSFEGSQGQLFSIVNRLGTGSIFSVNDVSGIPSLDIDASGRIHMAAFTGFVGVGLTAPSQKFHVSGNALITGDIALNGGTLSTTSTTGNLFNATATTLNIGGAATTTNIAAVASGLTLNIADTSIGSGTKQINIGTNISGVASETVTIGANSGRIVSRSGIGVCFGGQPTSNFEFIGGGNINATSQTINASALNAVNGVCAAGISAGSYILTSAGIKSVTGTTYTFIASDNGDVLTHDNASGCTFTIPTGLPVGYSTTVIRLNATGRVSFVPASGVTMNSYGGFSGMAGQHGSASLISYATNIYNLSGTLS